MNLSNNYYSLNKSKHSPVFRLLIIFGILLFCSSLITAQWKSTNGPYGCSIKGIAFIGSKMYSINTTYGVYLSTDKGENWKQMNTGLPMANGMLKQAINTIVASGKNLLVGNTWGQVYISTNEGESWSPASNGIPSNFTGIITMAVNGKNIFAGGMNGSGIIRSTDFGANWERANSGLVYTGSVNSIVFADTNLFAATGDGVFFSTNNGTTWVLANKGLQSNGAYSLAVNGKYVYAGTTKGVFVTSDNGQNWEAINTGLPNTGIFKVAVINNTLFAAPVDNDLYCSTDNGASWTIINNGLPMKGRVEAITYADSNLYAGMASDKGVFRSSDMGLNWFSANKNLGKIYFNALCAAGDNVFAASLNDGGFKMNPDGNGWSFINKELNSTIRSFAVKDSNVYAGLTAGLFRSTDYGNTWSLLYTGQGLNFISSIAFLGDNILFGDPYKGVAVSKDKGATWAYSNTGLNYNKTYTLPLLVYQNTIFAGTGNGIYFSTNNGASWSLNASTKPVQAFASAAAALFVNTPDGFFSSDDNGGKWNLINSNTIYPLLTCGSTLFAKKYGILTRTTDNGKTWSDFNDGLPDSSVSLLAANGKNIYVATNYGVYVRPLNDLLTEVERQTLTKLSGFSLEQNYPNPFNPSTSISFTIASELMVALKIYDLMGREIASVVSERLKPGKYSRMWNSEGLSSGVYFYRLQAGSYTETKKLCLIK